MNSLGRARFGWKDSSVGAAPACSSRLSYICGCCVLSAAPSRSPAVPRTERAPRAKPEAMLSRCGEVELCRGLEAPLSPPGAVAPCCGLECRLVLVRRSCRTHLPSAPQFTLVISTAGRGGSASAAGGSRRRMACREGARALLALRASEAAALEPRTKVPAWLPAWLVCLAAWLSGCLPTGLPACRPAGLPDLQPASQPASQPANQPASPPARVTCHMIHDTDTRYNSDATQHDATRRNTTQDVRCDMQGERGRMQDVTLANIR